MKGELEYLMSVEDKLGNYVDRWVAVVEERIVAEGDTAREVFEKAKKQFPNKIPFIMKVPADDIMVM